MVMGYQVRVMAQGAQDLLDDGDVEERRPGRIFRHLQWRVRADFLEQRANIVQKMGFESRFPREEASRAPGIGSESRFT